MAFQTPITIKEALDSIHRHDYALPAIQREFVWDREQISMLFDSLMRGYPIGSFLFWNVLPENSTQYVFYDFIRDYHGLHGRHCPTLALPEPRPVTAILDGQQRLTSLNIGLNGSHSEKLPRLRHNNPHAYPKKHLYLDLAHHLADEELGYVYRFVFLTPGEAASAPDGTHWFRVSDVLQLPDGPPMFKYIQEAGLADHRGPDLSLRRRRSATSVLIPIADYLYQREATDSYLTGSKHQEDRAAIRFWIIRSLMKSGIWGSGLDTLLGRLRRAIRESPTDRFPIEAIEQTMLSSGKSLRFEPEEVEDLAETPYGNRRAFPILAVLYTGANVQQSLYHEDHIFPRSRFTRARLLKAGVPEAQIEEFMEYFNLLPNLQLLPGAANTQKQAFLPLEWWTKAEPDTAARQALFAAHHMHDLPAEITDFMNFYVARRVRMLQRLRDLLGVQAVPSQTEAVAPPVPAAP